MKTKLTSEQVRWAMSHDWFIRQDADGSVWVYGDDGAMIWTGSFKALRDWAGY